MAHLGVRISDVPGTIGWDGLLALYRHADETWATWRAQHRDQVGDWCTTLRTNALLADCVDAISWLAYVVACANLKHGAPKPQRPKPVARPWATADGDRHIGSGAIPRCEFLAWYYEGE